MSQIKKEPMQHGGASLSRHQNLKKKWPEYYYLLKHTIKSEEKLVDTIKKYNNMTNDYYTRYYEHLDNLVRLDQMFENFDSFRKSFEIVFGEFKDKKKISEQSLLLSNYRKLAPFTKPEDMIKHHLIQQVIYLLANMYNANERLLIKQVLIQDILSKPTISIVTSDGKITDPIALPHSKYHIDYVKLKQIIDQGIRHMRDKLNMSPEYKSGLKQSVEDIKFDPKTMPLVKFNDPMPNKPIADNFAVKKLSARRGNSGKKDKPASAKKYKPVSIKKDKPASFKKDKPASIKKDKPASAKKQQQAQQKKINEISIPVEQKMLPALKVEIPQKK
jgi:hypothetical protein